MNILLALFKDAALATVRKVSWQAVLERYMTRKAIKALQKLQGMQTNDLTKQGVTDIVASLQGKKLKVADEFSPFDWEG